MRKVKFNELNLKDIDDVNIFYQYYLKTLQSELEPDSSFTLPTKQYEIFSLDELDGKIFLLNKNYIKKEDISGQELFFDYSIVFKIYNLMLDIYDGIDDEKNEFNELYLNERLKKDNEIEVLKKQDEEMFSKSLENYNTIIHSEIYNNYLKLLRENEELKKENKKLKQINTSNLELQTNNNNFFRKIINKIKNHIFS